MAICYPYTRASTKDQENTYEVQAEALEKYYREKLLPKFTDLGWGGVYCDKAISGSKHFTERPVGRVLNLRLVRGDHVVIFKLDRGFRDTLDFLTVERAFEERGITLHVLDLPWLDAELPKYIRDMIRTVLAMIAQFERERTRERTREIKQWLKRQGRPTNGHAGYGFKFTGRKGKRERIRDDEERQRMREIVERAQKGETCDEIYRDFLERGILTREGKKWSRSRIWRACGAELYLQARELEQRGNGAGEGSASK